MTSRSLLAALARRWYVAVGVLALVAALTLHLGPAGHVYWVRGDVVFLPPDRADGTGNALEGSDESLVFFAAAVERRINGDHEPPRLSSTDATIYCAGILRGQTTTLPNAGGQWQTNYNQPVLTIQATDATPDAALARFRRAAQRVQDEVAGDQTAAGVPATSMVRTRLAPESPPVVLVLGSTRRAQAGMALLGLLLATGSALVADRLLASRARRPSRMRWWKDHALGASPPTLGSPG